MIKLLIIDDHFVVRSGPAVSLDLEADLQVVAEAERGEQTVVLFEKHKPDVVLMDLQLPVCPVWSPPGNCVRSFPKHAC